jgi:hypothetical protein
MARGWESKSVEAQQEASEQSVKPRAPRLTREEAAHRRQAEILNLSRQRVAQQLASSRDPRHRQMLEEALADLDKKIRGLGGEIK